MTASSNESNSNKMSKKQQQQQKVEEEEDEKYKSKGFLNDLYTFKWMTSPGEHTSEGDRRVR